MSLKGKRVVVIGGTSGIGLATARAAAQRGAEVVVASRRRAAVDAAMAQLPDGTTGHVVDVLDAAAVDALFERLGELDHLVYTAGEALSLMPLETLDLDAAREFFETRYFGALAALRASAPRVRAGGSLTLTGGTASTRPGTGWSVSASVCAAMEGLTRALAVELAPVRVNIVRPGVVRSPLWSGLGENEREQFYKGAAQSTLVGHAGETDEIAGAYLFCMEQTYATGSIIPVDGGGVLL